jgi:hypothetical protein
MSRSTFQLSAFRVFHVYGATGPRTTFFGAAPCALLILGCGSGVMRWGVGPDYAAHSPSWDITIDAAPLKVWKDSDKEFKVQTKLSQGFDCMISVDAFVTSSSETLEGWAERRHHDVSDHARQVGIIESTSFLGLPARQFEAAFSDPELSEDVYEAMILARVGACEYEVTSIAQGSGDRMLECKRQLLEHLKTVSGGALDPPRCR